MATDYTTHYNLDKYTATDKPNLRDQYNAAMDKIDAELWAQHADAADAKSMAQSALAQVEGKVTQEQLNQAIAPLASVTQMNTAINNATAPLATKTEMNTAINTATAPLATKTELNNAVKIARRLTRRLVVVGDSLSSAVGATNAWPILIRRWGYTTYNFSNSGSGFLNASSDNNKTFSTLLNEAINSTQFSNDDITDVIIIGGVNDWNFSGTAVAQAAATLVETAYSAFKNATIHVGAMLKGIRPLDINSGNANKARSILIPSIQDAAAWKGASIIPHPWNWLMGYDSADVDGIHVNDNGQIVIAQNMHNYLEGGTVINFKRIFANAISGVTTGSNGLNIYTDEYSVHVRGQLTASSAIGTNVAIFDLPSWTKFGSQASWPPILGLAGYSDRDNGYGSHAYLHGNNAQIVASGLAAGQGIWFSGTYPFGI